MLQARSTILGILGTFGILGISTRSLSDPTLKRFLIRVSHDGLPAGDVCEQIGVGITTPSMGYQHDPFGHPFIHTGLHFDPAAVGLDHHRITVLNAVLLSRFRSDLGQGLREKFLKGLDLVKLAVGIIKVAVADGEDQRVFCQK